MSDLALVDGFFATPHRFVWHAASRTAICSDLHLGIESSLADAGIPLPSSSTNTLAAWQHITARNPAHIVVAGDLFDSAAPGESAIEMFRNLLAVLPSDCPVTLTPGNHDPSADLLADVLPELLIRPARVVGGYTVTHGHKLPPELRSAGNLIVGHQHPAIVLRSRVQSAKMFCYAEISTPMRHLLILPPFSRTPLGTHLLTDHHWILDLPRPSDKNIRILGLIEPKNRDAQILDFGPVAFL